MFRLFQSTKTFVSENLVGTSVASSIALSLYGIIGLDMYLGASETSSASEDVQLPNALIALGILLDVSRAGMKWVDRHYPLPQNMHQLFPPQIQPQDVPPSQQMTLPTLTARKNGPQIGKGPRI